GPSAFGRNFNLFIKNSSFVHFCSDLFRGRFILVQQKKGGTHARARPVFQVFPKLVVLLNERECGK
ncbi:MAG: hypothetical protein ACKO5E_06760, partial [bacterium]